MTGNSAIQESSLLRTLILSLYSFNLGSKHEVLAIAGIIYAQEHIPESLRTFRMPSRLHLDN